MYDDDIVGMMLEGIDDYDDVADAGFSINGPEDMEEWVGAALRARTPRNFLATVSAARPGAKLAKTKMGIAVSRLGKISKQVLTQTGRLEADYLRRPNTLCSIYGAALAPAATVAFSVTPGVGNAFYRLLGFICSDEQANVFGFTSLRVGGQDHVSFSQTAPAQPVANAVPWSIFALKESRLLANLAPWTGQVFDQSSPVAGTIANITTAAASDAVTVAPRIVLLSQTDPCGYRYTQLTEQSKGYWKTLRRNVGAYAPLMLGK